MSGLDSNLQRLVNLHAQNCLSFRALNYLWSASLAHHGTVLHCLGIITDLITYWARPAVDDIQLLQQQIQLDLAGG
ncbi:uncharacterized protein PgNI_01166, partial [Pyricularia grisea]|uniref:Uncharacterized protein n=1 Tax=Pyricularia grisea TaxID=148305 RepID=A0A6P8BFA6_PYRGI